MDSFQSAVADVASAVAIPIVLSGNQQGLLYVDRLESNANGAYRNSDLRLLSFFAGVLGVFLSVREGERRSRAMASAPGPAVDDAYTQFLPATTSSGVRWDCSGSSATPMRECSSPARPARGRACWPDSCTKRACARQGRSFR
ncbi:MAG: hypothetical protein R3E12_08185 [Candidatus Eisenbacteria bacterium]